MNALQNTMRRVAAWLHRTMRPEPRSQEKEHEMTEATQTPPVETPPADPMPPADPPTPPSVHQAPPEETPPVEETPPTPPPPPPTPRSAHRSATEAIVASLDNEDAMKAQLADARAKAKDLQAALDAQNALVADLETQVEAAEAETVTFAQDGITALQQLVASRTS